MSSDVVRIELPDQRRLVVSLPDDGPHHIGLSYGRDRGDLHVYVDGRSAVWRWDDSGPPPAARGGTT